MTTSLNKYSFCRIHIQIPFCIKTNLRENRFFAARWAVAGKKVTHNVKIYTEKITMVDEGTSHRVDQLTS